MRGRQFVYCASQVLLLVRDEAGIRSAVSRAYYGAYHEAVALLLKLEVRVGRNHAEPQRILARIGALQTSQLLAALQSDRIKADYRVELPPVLEQFAKDRIEAAYDIISQLDALDTPQQLAEMKARLRARGS